MQPPHMPPQIVPPFKPYPLSTFPPPPPVSPILTALNPTIPSLRRLMNIVNMSSHIFSRLETAVADLAVVGVGVGFLVPAGTKIR